MTTTSECSGLLVLKSCISCSSCPKMTSFHLLQTRRLFFGRSATGIGAAALASLLGDDLRAGDDLKTSGALPKLHFAPKAKRVIYLFMSGGPSHLDLFDHKPKLK